MIKTVQEGLMNYRIVLRDYVAWMNEKRLLYNRICGRGKWSPINNWPATEFREFRRRNEELQTMAKVLSLTKEEKAAIDKECGIKTQEELAAEA